MLNKMAKSNSVKDGFIVDVLRDDEIVEIQTGSFGALREKLGKLLVNHIVRVVYPVAVERWILRIDKDGKALSRRKSPRRGSIYSVFEELTSLHEIIRMANLRLDIAFVNEEQVWQDDGKGSWRRKHWSLADRRLLAILGCSTFETTQDYVILLPQGLPAEFTSSDLSLALSPTIGTGNSRRLAGRIARVFRQLGLIKLVGKRGRAYLYLRVDDRVFVNPTWMHTS